MSPFVRTRAIFSHKSLYSFWFDWLKTLTTCDTSFYRLIFSVPMSIRLNLLVWILIKKKAWVQMRRKYITYRAYNIWSRCFTFINARGLYTRYDHQSLNQKNAMYPICVVGFASACMCLYASDLLSFSRLAQQLSSLQRQKNQQKRTATIMELETFEMQTKIMWLFYYYYLSLW